MSRLRVGEADVADRATAEPVGTANSQPLCGTRSHSYCGKRLARLLAGLLLPLSLCILCFPAWPQAVSRSAPEEKERAASNQAASSSTEVPQEEVISPGQVIIDGDPVLAVFERVGNLSPEERANAIKDRIIAAARDGGDSADEVRLQPHEGWIEIFAGNQPIMAVTNGDAKLAGKPRQQLAGEDAQSIRRAIVNYRSEHNWRMVLRDVLDALVATLVLVTALWLIGRIRWFIRRRIEQRIQASAHLEKKSTWHLFVAYLGPIVLAVGALLRWATILALAQVYLTITLGFFPYTRDISVAVTRWGFSQLALLARSGLNYIPNLFVLGAIALVLRYVVRLIRLIFAEISKGALKIRGFYPDWAEPTEKLIRLMALVLALIVAFPYLPGAKSPAFQGISIFLGVLLSLGSSSAVANAIAGTILTYMRSFLVGDWVQIGDITGEVVEKTLLVTRVLTPKAEIITIPNATVMGSAVKNYSIEGKKSGVIFHTTVTIGYDAPWRTVHQLLLEAALATNEIRQQPAPFVLQTTLNDFYVSYELNAYTNVPKDMLAIFSELHQNIQDRFNEAGVEICSPHFSSLRDGNTIAIPEQYHRADYAAPGFRIRTTEDRTEIRRAARG